MCLKTGSKLCCLWICKGTTACPRLIACFGLLLGAGYVNQHPNYQTTACKKLSQPLLCYSFTSSRLINTQTLVTVQSPPPDGISRSTSCAVECNGSG